jgi:hypothetical protein
MIRFGKVRVKTQIVHQTGTATTLYGNPDVFLFFAAFFFF